MAKITGGLTLQDLLRPRPVVQHWIEPGLLPRSGKLLFGGEAKTGKSWSSMSMAYSLASGSPLWGNTAFSATPAKVMILDKELGEETLANRTARFFGPLAEDDLDFACKNFVAFTGNPLFKFDNPANRGVLVNLVEEHQPNVIIIDPVSRFLAGSDSNNDDVAHFIETLDVVREKYRHLGLSYVLIHHFKKPEYDYKGAKVNPGAFYNFRGASRWADDADAVVTMQRVDHDGDNHWKLKCAVTTRHGAGPGEFMLDVKPDSLSPVSWSMDQDNIVRKRNSNG